MEHEPVPVTFKDGSTWEIKLSADEVVVLLADLVSQDFRAICNYVAPYLGLDAEARREEENLPTLSDWSVHQFRIINKALMMELLSASLLACLNSPREVRSWCVQQENGQPNKYAPRLHADVTALYFNDENKRPYRVIAEVTSHKVVTKAVMRRQIEQAWNHAKVEAMNRDGGLVYALVINGGMIGSDPRIWNVYRDFLRNTEPDEFVRLLPLYAADLLAVVWRIDDYTPPGGLQFGSGLLARIFDALSSAVSGEFMHDDPDDDWMCNMFVDMVLAEANETRSDGVARGRHKRAGKARRPAIRRRLSKTRWRPYGGGQEQAKLEKQPLVLVTLDESQVSRAKEVNGKRKRITHAVLCGQYGRIYGTQQHCHKRYTLWSKHFSSLFSKPLRTGSYAIDNFTSSFELERRLIDARDR